MTEQEKKIKRYVNAIERELRLPLKAKARINGDIGTDIHARLDVYKRQYVGCGVLGSAVCMDKIIANRVMDATGIPRCEWDLSLIHIFGVSILCHLSKPRFLL